MLNGYEDISGVLKMELSDEKTLITHSSQSARFLGYDIRVRRNEKVKPSGNHIQRTLNNQVELCIPLDDKIMKFLFSKKIIEQKDSEIRPVSRKSLLQCTEFEIVSVYNAELRGIVYPDVIYDISVPGQLIVLSTNEELNGVHLKSMENRISRVYMLEYGTDQRTRIISDSYFEV